MIKAVLILLLAAVTATADIRLALWDWLAADEAGAELWTPADLDGLALWLDAADADTLWADTNATTAATNNGLVARWDDKSGLGNHALQVGAGNNPQIIDGILHFAANKRLLVPDDESIRVGTNGFAVASVWSPFSRLTAGWAANTQISKGLTPRFEFWAYGAQNGQYMSASTNSASRLLTTYPIAGQTYITTSIRRGGVLVTGIDGTYGSTPANIGDASGELGLMIGSRNPRAADLDLRGTLPEIIMVKGNTEDEQKLEGYLAHKWGLAANLPAGHPYKSSPPTK